MQKNLPAIVETAEVAVEEANRVIQVELVPMAIEVLRDMLDDARSRKVSNADLKKVRSADLIEIDGHVTKSYTRLDLEIVKATFSMGGVGRSSQAKGKDPAKMTPEELANLLDGARIIHHEPAKALALDD